MIKKMKNLKMYCISLDPKHLGFIKNLEFHDCKDFLEMASIVKSSKFAIGNSSIVFPIAEGLKVPRLLEACPHFPAAQPHGANAFDFYFQSHFEKWFRHLDNLS